MKFSKFNAKIFGTDTKIVMASTEQPKTKIVKQPITHYILLIDRSGSMYSELNRLLDQVIETVDHIGSQNLLSVLWYSGANQCEVVIKASPASSDIKAEINKLRRTVGLTCFSHPLNKAYDLVSDDTIKVDQTAILLFTDGQPCVSWSHTEEEARCKTALGKMVESGLSAMTCIGYGNYYNRQFLIELSETTDHGQILHNSRIEEFLETFKTSVGAASDLIRQPFILGTKNPAHVTYLTDRSVLTYKDTFSVDLDSISAHRNDFYVTIDNANDDETISVTTNNETVSKTFASIKTKTSEANKQNYFYGLASRLYYYGRRKEALAIIVENTQDKFLADAMIAAFTNSEVANVQKLLDDAVFDTSKRKTDGTCPVDYLPKKDALCVMDIFKVLFDSEGSVYYVPFSKNVERYSRIGKKVEDQQNAFTKSDEEVRMPLSELKWNKDKPNLNVLFSIPGTVKLNARAAKAHDLPVDFPAKIYNTHTLVKDGSVNVGKAEFMMDSDTYSKVYKLAGHKVTDIPETTSNLHRVVIDFTNLPVINQTYIDEANNIDFIYDLVKENVSLEAKLKVVKAEIDTLNKSNADLAKDGIFATYNADQIRVLGEHGISDKGVYNGIDNKVVSTDSDSYEVRILDFSLAGFKTLPTVEAFRNMTASTKPVTSGPGKLMVAYYETLTEKLKGVDNDVDKKTILLAEKKTVEHKLSTNRQQISLVKLAKILNNDFFENLSKDDKGNFFFEKDLKMNIKSERKLQTI